MNRTPAGTGNAAPSRNLGCAVILLLIAAAVFRKWVIASVLYFYSFMDRLLALPGLSSPVARWVVLGLLLGLIYGGYVAVKKYNLNKWLFYTPALFTLIFTIALGAVNKPWASFNKPEDAYINQTYKVEAAPYVTVTSGTSFDESMFAALLDQDPSTTLTLPTKTLLTRRIYFRFDKDASFKELRDVRCTGFSIQNGAANSKRTWSNYERVKEAIVYLNGNQVSHLYFRDNPELGWQLESINSLPLNFGDVLSLQVVAVYSTKGKSKTAAITALVPVLEAGKPL